MVDWHVRIQFEGLSVRCRTPGVGLRGHRDLEQFVLFAVLLSSKLFLYGESSATVPSTCPGLVQT